MVIKLNGADFSQNNIGQIPVSINLHEYTEAAILASGNTNLTRLQKSALNSLFLAMGVDGSNNIMSKMRKLYIPMIADDVSNALINYATNSFTKELTPNSTNWELRNHGIAQKESGQSLALTLNSPLVGTNITQIWLRTENMVSGVDDKCINFVLRGKTDTNLFLGCMEESSSSNNFITWYHYGFSLTEAYEKTNEQRVASGLSVRASNDVSLRMYESVKTISTISPVDMSGETSQTLYVLGVGNQTAPRPFGLMLLGEAVTDADFNNLCDKIDALYDSFAG